MTPAHQHRRRHRRLEHARALEQFVQRQALQVLHHQVADAVGRGVEVHHLHDARVANRHRRAALAAKALGRLGVAGRRLVEELDGEARAQLEVRGQVHDAHRPVPQRALEAVAAADHRSGLEVLNRHGRAGT